MAESGERLDKLTAQIKRWAPQTTSVQNLLGEINKDIARRKNNEVELSTLLPSIKTGMNGKQLATPLDLIGQMAVELNKAWGNLGEIAKVTEAMWSEISNREREYERFLDNRTFDWRRATDAFVHLKQAIILLPAGQFDDLLKALDKANQQAGNVWMAKRQGENDKSFLDQTRSPLDRKKLLDYLLDEKQEKLIDIKEGTRSHIAVLDNYLKRLAIALEDDFLLQFYEPSFARIRRASRQWNVTLGQIERTSVLTNNRAYAAVHPTATMEFDLPKRDILLVEAMNGAKALTQDMGALLNDPTFLAAFKMMGGGPPATQVINSMPGLPSQPDQKFMGVNPNGQDRPLGASLEALIPDPAIYKIETGTGYEIRPVIQPDGDSIVYDFTYMYTTTIREPVRADEKHLGRVKRHFIDTQVQTSSFELREVSRYQVALKAARTAQGVPLLQQIPVAGWLFRPMPSAESSIQENIVLAQSVVYPTVFDLMGLDWAPSIVDLDHVGVRDMEHVVRGRNETINNAIFDMTTGRVDELLDLEHSSPENLRPDLRRTHTQPSPHHPGGYTYPAKIEDPTGHGFQIPDRRPQEMREPPYDRRFRHPIRSEEVPESLDYEHIGDEPSQTPQDGPALRGLPARPPIEPADPSKHRGQNGDVSLRLIKPNTLESRASRISPPDREMWQTNAKKSRVMASPTTTSQMTRHSSGHQSKQSADAQSTGGSQTGSKSGYKQRDE